MNRILKTSIFTIVIIIIGVESFLLIRSFIKNEETNDINNILEQELENISKENNETTTDYLLTIIDNNKLNIFDQFKTNIGFQETDIQNKLMYAYWYLKDDYDFSKGVSEKVIERLIFNVFSDEETVHQNVKCDCGKNILIYNKERKIYELSDNHPNHNELALAYGAIYNKALSLTISNNQYKLITTKLFVGSERKIYSSAILEESNYLFEYNLEETKDDIIKKYETDYDELKDRIVKYSYTFEKKNGKFVLIKYEILD